MRLEQSFSIERFQSYTTSKIGKNLVRPRGIFSISSRSFVERLRIYPRMSRKCQEKECSLCSAKFLGRRHHHPDGWSSVLKFFKEESRLNVSDSKVCVCEACNVSIRQAKKCRDNGELYQLRWLKSKKESQCCVPSCKSVDIKAEKHEFTWEVICYSIGIASVNLPGNISLCTKHYQQVYRMLNAKSDACM